MTVLASSFARERHRSVTFSAARTTRGAARRPANVARMLALAHHIRRAIDEGRFADQADVARHMGLTRARLSQVLDLLVLAPDIQAELLALEAVDGVEPLAERALRPLVRCLGWSTQREAWVRLRPSIHPSTEHATKGEGR